MSGLDRMPVNTSVNTRGTSSSSPFATMALKVGGPITVGVAVADRDVEEPERVDVHRFVWASHCYLLVSWPWVNHPRGGFRMRSPALIGSQATGPGAALRRGGGSSVRSAGLFRLLRPW